LYSLSGFAVFAALDIDIGFDKYNQAPYEGWMEWAKDDTSIDLGKTFKDQALKPWTDGKNMFEKLLKFLGIDPASLTGDAGGILWFIKSLINIVLSFAGFIALCFMIYGFVRIFFSPGEEAVKQAWTIVRISAIAIAIISLAWFIESAMFYIYESLAKP
jgi:hypothetical protein